MRWTVSCTALLVLQGFAPAHAAVFTTATATSAHDSVGIKTAQVECPAGTFPIGGGAWVGGEFESYRGLLTSSTLYDIDTGDPIGWTARAMEVATDSNGWNLSVRAVCGRVTGLERVIGETGNSSDGYKDLFLECPAGKSPLSGGFAIENSIFGPTVIGSKPALDPDTREPDGWYLEAREVEPSAAIWGLSGEVICADRDVTVVRAISGPPLALQDREIVLVCPAGMIATGGGGSVLASGDFLVASYLESSIAWKVGVTRLVGETGPTQLDSYAVCPEAAPTLSFVVVLGALGLGRRRSRFHRPPGRASGA